MAKKLRDAVVVVTGASSGIGRATAVAFAREGARVVVAARREEPLNAVVAECGRLGTRAVAVPTDVANEAAVQELARRAVEAFGRIDVWVNNAAVALFGRFEETPSDVYRQVIETDLFGYIYGARAVLPVFHAQGRGVLINTGSMVSVVPVPYLSAYAVAKQGVRALGESLRQELALEKASEIHVSTVMPATIDTPLFQHAGNYTGRTPKAMPPVYPPELVAKTIVAQAKAGKPRREVFVGNAARLARGQFLLSPAATERAVATMVDQQHLTDEPAPRSAGNVLAPVPEGTTATGGWQGKEQTRLRQAAAVGLAAVPAALALQRLRPHLAALVAETRAEKARRSRRTRWTRLGGRAAGVIGPLVGTGLLAGLRGRGGEQRASGGEAGAGARPRGLGWARPDVVIGRGTTGGSPTAGSAGGRRWVSSIRPTVRAGRAVAPPASGS